jgi:hypothetical protein
MLHAQTREKDNVESIRLSTGRPSILDEFWALSLETKALTGEIMRTDSGRERIRKIKTAAEER